MRHAYEGHGFRFEVDGKIISYTGDTGLCDPIYSLAKNADLLITECANKKTEENDAWGHLDPIQAATLASETNVKNLILTHFGASLYTEIDDRRWAESEARKIFPNTIAAIDGFEFEL